MADLNNRIKWHRLALLNIAGWGIFQRPNHPQLRRGYLGYQVLKRTHAEQAGRRRFISQILRMNMNVELHTEQGVKVIVPLVRRLDASVASAFKQQVLEALDGQTKTWCWT